MILFFPEIKQFLILYVTVVNGYPEINAPGTRGI
jgi:hypothetical protein